VLWLRSAVFNAAFYLSMIVQMIVFLPVLALPRHRGVWVVHNWARLSVWLLRVICGTRVEIRGAENIPTDSAIVAAKHQSFLETFALVPVLGDFAYILKRELNWIPFFGWYTLRHRMIGVTRGARGRAVQSMLAAVRAELARADRQIIIFPEGTRRPPGAPPQYKSGVVALYAELGLKCVPVAVNTGLFWPRRKFVRYPGTAVISFLPAIAPGLDREAFLAELERRIETETAALLAEGRAQLSGLGVS
jgi:1-acyl-sn-glycerol-3-phosphate acyltransferase